MSITRRSLLRSTGALAIPWAGLLTPRRASAGPPLVADPAGLLDLPAGFTYTVLEATGDPMTDGYVVPSWPDGMGLFDFGAELVLMRNHELFNTLPGPYPTLADAPPEAYDANEMGGVTRLVVDATTYARLRSNLVLAGTKRNCAGGVAPGAWLSCEEATLPRNHGFVFRCDATAEFVQPAVRLTAMGRFNHEAAARDATTGDVYLTEDRPNGAFYRLLVTGALQAMKVVGSPGFDTGAMLAGEVLPVEWVTLVGTNPPVDNLRFAAAGQGAAMVRRGEGIAVDGRTFTFAATTGGALGQGQLLVYRADTSELECLAVSTDPNVLDMPDNLVTAPWAQLFFGENGSFPNFVRCLTSAGAFCDVASSPTSEMTGLCFAPAGDAMFLNLQQDGLTVVVTGPFQTTFDV